MKNFKGSLVFCFLIAACSGSAGGPAAPGGQGNAVTVALNVDVAGCGDPVLGGSAWAGAPVTAQNLGTQWRLQNGLIPIGGTNPCPPPNGFFCDPETITLVRQNDTTLSFMAVFPAVSIQDIDQWTLSLTGGSDQEATRPASVRLASGEPAPFAVSNISLAGSSANGSYVDGCMIMTRTDNNSTSYYRVQQGSPGSF